VRPLKAARAAIPVLLVVANLVEIDAVFSMDGEVSNDLSRPAPNDELALDPTSRSYAS
jgi:hypothetical protein